MSALRKAAESLILARLSAVITLRWGPRVYTFLMRRLKVILAGMEIAKLVMELRLQVIQHLSHWTAPSND